MNHWKVSGVARTCPECLRPYRFVITDEQGREFGCRPSHYEAMTWAQRKAKHFGSYYARRGYEFPLAA